MNAQKEKRDAGKARGCEVSSSLSAKTLTLWVNWPPQIKYDNYCPWYWNMLIFWKHCQGNKHLPELSTHLLDSPMPVRDLRPVGGWSWSLWSKEWVEERDGAPASDMSALEGCGASWACEWVGDGGGALACNIWEPTMWTWASGWFCMVDCSRDAGKVLLREASADSMKAKFDFSLPSVQNQKADTCSSRLPCISIKESTNHHPKITWMH